MKKLIHIILLFRSLTVAAQITTLKEHQGELKDYAREYFRVAPGQYAVFEYPGTIKGFIYKKRIKEPRFTVYDENLNISSSFVVEGLQQQQYLGGLEKNGSLQLFFEEKEQVYTAGFDLKTGQLKDVLLPIYKVEKETQHFFKGCSIDSVFNYALSTYTVSKGNHQMFDGVIFDRDMKVITNFSVKLEDLGETFETIKIHQNTEGSLLITSSVRVKKTRKAYMPLAWLITEVDRNGKSVTTFLEDIPEGRFENVIWGLTKEGISFTGLLSKGKKEGYKSIITGDYNIWRKKVGNIKETDIGDDYWKTLTVKDQLKSPKDGLPISRLINEWTLPDGTRYIVLQGHENFTGRTSTGALFFESHGKSIYALSIAPNHSLNWVKEIPVFHTELSWQIYTGCLATFHSTKGIFIFYNDGEENINRQAGDKAERVDLGKSWKRQLNTYAINIKPNGALTRVIAGTYMDSDHHLAIGEAYKFYGNELFFSSYRSRNLGRSTYKPALFIIK